MRLAGPTRLKGSESELEHSGGCSSLGVLSLPCRLKTLDYRALYGHSGRRLASGRGAARCICCIARRPDATQRRGADDQQAQTYAQSRYDRPREQLHGGSVLGITPFATQPGLISSATYGTVTANA